MTFAAGCAPRSHPPPQAPWTTVALGVGSVDVPYEAVTVREVARHKPPDGVTWPAALDFRGQTAWLWDGDDPVLYASPYAAPGSVKDSEETGAAFAYVWSLRKTTIERRALANTPAETSWPAIPYPEAAVSESAVSDDIDFACINPTGQSATHFLTIDDGEPVGVPIVDSISSSSLPERDMAQHELAAGVFFSPMERIGAPSLVFLTYIDLPVDMPNGITRLATNWMRIGLQTPEDPLSLGPAVAATFGAELSGFMGDPAVYFFRGRSPFDNQELTFVSNLTSTVAIRPWEDPTMTDGLSGPLRTSDFIPAVEWAGEHVVFAELGERSGDSFYAVAIRLDLADLERIEPEVIWASEVPDIFELATVVSVGTNGRPYIVCLDPVGGGITVFDPLLGSIRYQGTIDLAAGDSMMHTAAFCVNFDPDPARPTLFIHDPNANEIIELAIETRAPVDMSHEVRTVPQDDAPTD